MSFNIENIKKVIIKNSQIIMIVLVLVFMYLLFYTDYLIINSTYSKVNDGKNEMMAKHKENQQNIQLEIEQKSHKPTDQIISTNKVNENKHVKFDNSKNQEILFENSNGRLNIDYQSPQLNELQKISQCTYKMNTPDQLNMRDCTINPNKSCLTKYSPQEWFKKQREAKVDLPGFNGDNLAQFKTDEQDKYSSDSKMMRDMVYENVGCYVENKSPIDFNVNMNPNQTTNMEKFNGYNTDLIIQPDILYQNAPFINSPQQRGTLPNDKCRNCIVGYCSGDSCGSELNIYGPEYGAYFN
jgi:hypothetical protein